MTSLMEVPSVETSEPSQSSIPAGLSPFPEELSFPFSLAPTTPRPMVRPKKRLNHWPKVFLLLAALSLLALLIDGVLAVFVFHPSGTNVAASRPLLHLGTNTASQGQVVEVSMSHFASRARVRLTRDVQEVVRIDQAAGQQGAYIQMDASGQGRAHLRIDERWEVGNHVLVAEDVTTRYVASVSLQIVGAGPAQPPHMQLSQEHFDLGSSLQGSNSIQSLHLRNTGSGMISWVASSDHPWLSLTPMEGTFSSGQTVLLAASRAGLKAGDYTATILLVDSTGSTQKVTVKMSVQSLPSNPGPVLSITPAAFSFAGFDGVSDPADQTLKISNLGNKPLHWSLASQVQMASLSEVTGFQTHLDWLSMQPTQGTIEPGGTQAVRLRVKSQSLLSDVYSGIVSLKADQKALNNPQSLALSLNVRPPCSVVASSERLVLHASLGQHSPPQHLNLSVAQGCKGQIDWQASSQNTWLHVTPAKGTLASHESANLNLEIDASHLKPGTYMGSLVVVAGQSSQALSVQAVISATGEQAKTAGLTLSPSQLSFDIVQGQSSSAEQRVVIANTGQTDLIVHATGGAPWLQSETHEMTLIAGTTASVPVRVNAGGLDPGSYSTYVSLTATDESGNAVADGSQTLTVSLNVRQPCGMTITPNALSFQSSLLDSSPASQTISLSETGTCSSPVTWNVSADEQWIVLGSSTVVDNGGGTQLTVNVNPKWKILGTYQGHITFVAYDSSGAALNRSPQTISVTLRVNS